MRTRNIGVIVLKVLEHAIIAIVAFAVLFPVFWLWMTAFKTGLDAYSLKLSFTPTLQNFTWVLFAPKWFGLNLINSFIVSGLTTLISVAVAVPAAYSFSRFRLIGKKNILFWIISLQFMPPVVMLIPLFMLFRNTNLLDTHLCLIITYLTIGVPFSIWILKGFIDGVPKEMEEAAMVDGCSLPHILLSIVVPTIKPAIIVAAILTAILTINEFFFALVLTENNAVTMPIALVGFHTNYGILWERMAAAGVLMMIPVFAFAFLIQKHVVRGLTMGAIK